MDLLDNNLIFNTKKVDRLQLTKQARPPTTGVKLEHTPVLMSREWNILFLEDSFCNNNVD